MATALPVLRQFFQTSLKTGIQRSSDLSLLLLPSIMRENSGASCGIVGGPARWVLPLTLLPAHGTHTLHGHPFEHFITRGFGTLRQRSGRRRLGACGKTASIAAWNSLNSQAIFRDKPNLPHRSLQRTAKRSAVKIQGQNFTLSRCHSSCNARQSWRILPPNVWGEDQADEQPA